MQVKPARADLTAKSASADPTAMQAGQTLEKKSRLSATYKRLFHDQKW
jgi:hypothetical protein